MSFGTGDIPGAMPVPANSVIATNGTDDAWIAVPYPVSTTRAFNSPSRSLNTAFQVSSTQDASVNYSVDITTALSLTSGAAGTVYLEYADNSGFTTNVKEVCHFTSANTGTLVVGLAINQQATAQLGGLIPAAKYVRLRTNNSTGTPTYGTPVCQEVLL